MVSPWLLGVTIGSALAAAACSTTATLGVEFDTRDARAADGSAGAPGDGAIQESGDETDGGEPRDAIDPTSDGSVAVDGGLAGLPAFCANYPGRAGWESSAVFYGSGKKLSYVVDAEGNKIPDFSYAGYEYGGAIPSVPEVIHLDPNNRFWPRPPGDDTARIQAAIDQVGQRPIGANGYRGAVVLGSGVFFVSGVLALNHSGVVLRGSGHGSDPATNTVILGSADLRPSIIGLGSGADNGWVDDLPVTRTTITTSVVPVGSRVFQVADATNLSPGENIIISQPLTAAWLAAVNGGQTGTDPAWTVNAGPLAYNRHILAKTGNELTIDAPIFHHLSMTLGKVQVSETRRTNIVNHVGLENVFIDSAYDSMAPDRHATNGVDFVGVEDAWIRDTVIQRFVQAGVHVLNGVRITVSNVEANDPYGSVVPGHMHNFALDARSQLVLFTGCSARNGRHHFAGEGPMSSSGNVFYRCRSAAQVDAETSGGLRLFTQGLLFDNITQTGLGSIALGCLAESGFENGHGWGAVHSVLWNCVFDQSHGFAEKPPTGQNYAIGRTGLLGKIGACGDMPSGFIEQNDMPLRQASLYEAQLCDRLRP
jgi:hypothetical protein